MLAAARELGYVPDLSARRLRHRLGASTAPDLVLAVLRPAGTALGNAAHVIEAAQAALAALPGGPTAAQLVLEEYEPGRLAAHPGLVGGARFHGGIVTGMTPQDEAAFAAGAGTVPLVAFQRRVAGRAYVDVDNVRGGAQATQHLLAQGRRRIVALSYAFPPHARSRTAWRATAGRWPAPGLAIPRGRSTPPPGTRPRRPSRRRSCWTTNTRTRCSPSRMPSPWG